MILNRSTFLRLAASSLLLTSAPTVATAADGKVYELRIYVTNEGKLENLLTRFRDHTCSLFEKHGIENIGYWVPIAKEDGADNTLIYIVAHPDRETAKANWKAFGSDPQWQVARKASEEGGKILAKAPESIFMETTTYSPQVKTFAGEKERTFELRTYTTPPGKLPALHDRFTSHTMKLFTKHGMSHIGYWVPTDPNQGAQSKLIYVLAHASKEAGLAAFAAFRADPDWVKAKADSEKDGSLTLPQPEGVKSVYLRAVDFSPLR